MPTRIILQCVVFVVTGLASQCYCDLYELHSEQDALRELFSGYSPDARPVKNPSKPLNVSISVVLKKMIKLDQINEELHTSFSIVTHWNDDYLQWDPSIANLDYLQVPGTAVWTPNIKVSNSLRDNNEADISFDNERLSVFANGVVLGSTSFRLRTGCSILLGTFPFDSQTCYIAIHVNAGNTYLALQHSQHDGLLDFGDDRMEYNDEWKNIEISQTVSPYELQTTYGSQYFDILIAVITMDRNPTFYVIYLVIPSVLMAFVSVVGFLLPPESGERVGLSITVLLSYTVLLLMVSDFTPRGGTSTPMLAYYITFVEFLSGFNLLLTVVVMRIHHHSADDVMPTCLRRLCCTCGSPTGGSTEWQRLAHRLDKIFFGVTFTFVLLATTALFVLILR